MRYDNHYLGETYDARRELAGWNTPGFDAAAWAAARQVGGPGRRARAQNLERTSLTWRPSRPATRSEPRPGVHRLGHRPAARGLGHDQRQRRARGHADPDPLRREARHRRPRRASPATRPPGRSRPTTTSPRARAPQTVHAAVHLQGLPVRAAQRGRRHGAAGRDQRVGRLRAGDPRADGGRPARSTPPATCRPDRPQHPLLGRRELRLGRDHRHADLREERLGRRRAALRADRLADVRHRAPLREGPRRTWSTTSAPRRGPAALARQLQLRLRGRPRVQAGQRRRDPDLGRVLVRRSRGRPTCATATAGRWPRPTRHEAATCSTGSRAGSPPTATATPTR